MIGHPLKRVQNIVNGLGITSRIAASEGRKQRVPCKDHRLFKRRILPLQLGEAGGCGAV
jgi:hypothetical protein